MENEVFYSNSVYHLSYNPDPITMGTKEENWGREETAICIKDPCKYLILFGDHREKMIVIQNDLEALKAYWFSLPALHGDTTDTL